jgi:hypothetical protein
MGYLVNKLASIKIDDDVSIYIFVINGQFRGEYFEVVERHFRDIARNLGDHGVIAQGLNEFFSDEVCRTYLGRSIETLWDLLPAVLVTDAHPERLTDKSMRIVIPLSKAKEKFGNLDTFFRGLSEFCRNRSETFLARLEQKDDWFDHVEKVVELKPEFMGISVNINEFLRRVFRRKNLPPQLET